MSMRRLANRVSLLFELKEPSNDDAFEILPDRVLQHVMRGDQLTRLRQYDQAVEEYRAALKEAGKPVFTVYLNLGTLFFNKDDYPHAIETGKLWS